jgi:3-oxoadipate enol-lactonase
MMNRASVNGTTIAYETQGEGEPVLLLHCGFVAHSFHPLLHETVLTRRYRLINYHRRGYGESAPAQPPFGIDRQAEDCLALMDSLGIPQAHVVGHSFGGNIALELARRAPERVSTLALLEPPLVFALSAASAQIMGSVIGQAMQAFAAGDVEAAVNTWLTGAFGSDWQEVVEQNLPGGYRQVVADGPTALAVEAAALQTWAYGPDELANIRQPTLALYHRDARFAVFDDIQAVLVKHIPQVESIEEPNVSHLLQIEAPRTVAERLAAFLKHRSPVTAQS